MDISKVAKAQLGLAASLADFVTQNQNNNWHANLDSFQTLLKGLDINEFIYLKGVMDAEIEKRLAR